jgi:hypothetical protein
VRRAGLRDWSDVRGLRRVDTCRRSATRGRRRRRCRPRVPCGMAAGTARTAARLRPVGHPAGRRRRRARSWTRCGWIRRAQADWLLAARRSAASRLAEFTAWANDSWKARASCRRAGDASRSSCCRMTSCWARAFGALVHAGLRRGSPARRARAAGATGRRRSAGSGLPLREDLEAAQRAAWQHALAGAARATCSGAPATTRRAGPAQSAGAGPAPGACRWRRRRPAPAARCCSRGPCSGRAHGAAAAARSHLGQRYEDLRRCPYRFFALRQLGLQEADEIDAEVDKRDFGNWLHAVLRDFHESCRARPAARAHRLARPLRARDAQRWPGGWRVPAVRRRLAAVRDGYLAWLAKHEASGAAFDRRRPSTQCSWAACGWSAASTASTGCPTASRW